MFFITYSVLLYCKTREIGVAVEFCAHVTMVDLNRPARYCVAVVKPCSLRTHVRRLATCNSITAQRCQYSRRQVISRLTRDTKRINSVL